MSLARNSAACLQRGGDDSHSNSSADRTRSLSSADGERSELFGRKTARRALRRSAAAERAERESERRCFERKPRRFHGSPVRGSGCPGQGDLSRARESEAPPLLLRAAKMLSV